MDKLSFVDGWSRLELKDHANCPSGPCVGVHQACKTDSGATAGMSFYLQPEDLVPVAQFLLGLAAKTPGAESHCG